MFSENQTLSTGVFSVAPLKNNDIFPKCKIAGTKCRTYAAKL